MKSSWDPNSDIETLFNQIDATVKYATVVNTIYTVAQILVTAYQLDFNTSIFTNDCKTIRKPEVSHTYINFQPFLTSTQQELRKTPKKHAAAPSQQRYE